MDRAYPAHESPYSTAPVATIIRRSHMSASNPAGNLAAKETKSSVATKIPITVALSPSAAPAHKGIKKSSKSAGPPTSAADHLAADWRTGALGATGEDFMILEYTRILGS